MHKHLYFLLLVVALFGCQESERGAEQEEAPPRNGWIKKYNSEGILLSQAQYKDDVKHGRALSYYGTTEKLQFDISFQNGLKHGLTKTFYEDGKSVYRETTYQFDKKDSIERTYRKNGQMLAEIPYKDGFLGTGLKEYTAGGKLKTRTVPQIIIKEKNTLAMDNRFALELSVEPWKNKVSFYVGDLTDGQYMNHSLVPLRMEGNKGVFEINMGKGGFMMRTINIVAKVKTNYRNYYIVQQSYNLAIDNKAL